MRKNNAAPAAGRKQLIRKVALRFGLAGPALAALFFLSAGTLDYWQAWAYMAVLFIPMGFVLGYLIEKEPGLLERRLRMKEKEARQRTIMAWSSPVFLAVFLLPGLDRRWGWSQVPWWLVAAANAVVLAAYLRIFRVMRENPYLSRVVEVDPRQQIITTGPYAAARHPMYAAVLPLFLFTPLALGSLWALVPAAFIPPVIIARIFNEEQVLGRELAEYRRYARRVKFRLIPGVW